jgi:hypothetical protein
MSKIASSYAVSVETIDETSQEHQCVVAYNGVHEHLKVRANTKYCLHLHNNTSRATYVKVIVSETHLGTWLLKSRTSMKLESSHETSHQLVFDSNTFATFDACVEDQHRYHTSAITAMFLPAKTHSDVCRPIAGSQIGQGLWSANCDDDVVVHNGVIVTLPVLLTQ